MKLAYALITALLIAGIARAQNCANGSCNLLYRGVVGDHRWDHTINRGVVKQSLTTAAAPVRVAVRVVTAPARVAVRQDRPRLRIFRR